MPRITLQAHFDGQQIRLNELFDLQPDTKQEDWHALSAHNLSAAYGDNEPDYSLISI